LVDIKKLKFYGGWLETLIGGGFIGFGIVSLWVMQILAEAKGTVGDMGLFFSGQGAAYFAIIFGAGSAAYGLYEIRSSQKK